jgi:hypothetical protein
VNTIPKGISIQHSLAREAVQYANTFHGKLPRHLRCDAALAFVSRWAVHGSNDHLPDSRIGFVVRTASKFIIASYSNSEGDDQ